LPSYSYTTEKIQAEDEVAIQRLKEVAKEKNKSILS
jgi:hypothetical protein